MMKSVNSTIWIVRPFLAATAFTASMICAGGPAVTPTLMVVWAATLAAPTSTDAARAAMNRRRDDMRALLGAGDRGLETVMRDVACACPAGAQAARRAS